MTSFSTMNPVSWNRTQTSHWCVLWRHPRTEWKIICHIISITWLINNIKKSHRLYISIKGSIVRYPLIMEIPNIIVIVGGVGENQSKLETQLKPTIFFTSICLFILLSYKLLPEFFISQSVSWFNVYVPQFEWINFQTLGIIFMSSDSKHTSLH